MALNVSLNQTGNNIHDTERGMVKTPKGQNGDKSKRRQTKTATRP